MSTLQTPLPVATASVLALRSTVEPLAIARFSVPGEPASKSRARFTKQYSPHEPYAPGASLLGEQAVADSFRVVRPDWTVDSDGTYGVLGFFHAATFQRRDVDNMLKLILDSLTGVVWVDDSQVAEVGGRVERGVTVPQSEIFVYAAESAGDPPKGICIRCGATFRTYGSWSTRRFCSAACGIIERRQPTRTCKTCGCEYAAEPYEQNRLHCSPACRQGATTVDLNCVQCGSHFNQWKSWQPDNAALCSKDCSVAYWASRRTGNPKGICQDCRGPVSRKEYQRCRSCSIARSPQRARTPKSASRRAVLPAGTVVAHHRSGVVRGSEKWGARKELLLAFVAAEIEAGRNPRLADIRKAVDVPALGAVREMVEELRRAGLLDRQKQNPFQFSIPTKEVS